jgi:hypothetical protein
MDRGERIARGGHAIETDGSYSTVTRGCDSFGTDSDDPAVN